MNYEEEVFDNYQALAAKYPQTATALLEEVGEDDWQDSWLYYYPMVKDFTLHELDNGWYFNYKLKYDMDFDGALNLLDFIDYEALGKALTEGSKRFLCSEGIEAWYFDNCIFKTDNGEIITTEVGW